MIKEACHSGECNNRKWCAPSFLSATSLKLILDILSQSGSCHRTWRSFWTCFHHLKSQSHTEVSVQLKRQHLVPSTASCEHCVWNLNVLFSLGAHSSQERCALMLNLDLFYQSAVCLSDAFNSKSRTSGAFFISVKGSDLENKWRWHSHLTAPCFEINSEFLFLNLSISP